jgi:hypothetical protein
VRKQESRYLGYEGDRSLTWAPSAWVQWFRSSLFSDDWGWAHSEAEGHVWFEVAAALRAGPAGLARDARGRAAPVAARLRDGLAAGDGREGVDELLAGGGTVTTMVPVSFGVWVERQEYHPLIIVRQGFDVDLNTAEEAMALLEYHEGWWEVEDA